MSTILSERNAPGPPEPPEACPVHATCAMHRSAVRWLADNDRDALTEPLDIFFVLHRRVWRDCTCDLYRRILVTLGRKQPWALYGTPRPPSPDG